MATEAHRLSRQRIVKLTSSGKAKRPTASRPQTPHSDTPVIPKDSKEYINRLIRRDLLSNAKINPHEVLPTLTCSPAVDLELYALIGLFFQSFVNSWYLSLSTDTEFISELITFVAHVTRDLETRVMKVNVAQLLLDDIPLLLDEHLIAYRKVTRELGTSFLQFDTIDSAFDYVCPHKALGEIPRDVYLRILAHNVLERLLPKDESKSHLVKKFMDSLLSDLLLRIIVDKVSQPYQIFEIISLVCRVLSAEKDEPTPLQSSFDKLQSVLISLSHFIAHMTSVNTRPDVKPQRRVVLYHLPHFLNRIFMVNTFRPVLYSTIKSLTPLFLTERVDHIINNLVQNKLVNSIRSESLVLKVLRAARNNLFPTDEGMGPPRIEPTPEEFEQIRQTAKCNMREVCMKYSWASYAFIATSDAELDDVLDDFLTSLEHERINEHLTLRVLDLLVVRCFPEIGE